MTDVVFPWVIPLEIKTFGAEFYWEKWRAEDTKYDTDVLVPEAHGIRREAGYIKEITGYTVCNLIQSKSSYGYYLGVLYSVVKTKGGMSSMMRIRHCSPDSAVDDTEFKAMQELHSDEDTRYRVPEPLQFFSNEINSSDGFPRIDTMLVMERLAFSLEDAYQFCREHNFLSAKLALQLLHDILSCIKDLDTAGWKIFGMETRNIMFRSSQKYKDIMVFTDLGGWKKKTGIPGPYGHNFDEIQNAINMCRLFWPHDDPERDAHIKTIRQLCTRTQTDIPLMLYETPDNLGILAAKSIIRRIWKERNFSSDPLNTKYPWQGWYVEPEERLFLRAS